MLRDVLGPSTSDLERALLRRGVRARARGEVRCADCARHPLIGETIHRYGDATVCALCRPRRRREPDATGLVHHAEHGVTVRRAA